MLPDIVEDRREEQKRDYGKEAEAAGQRPRHPRLGQGQLYRYHIFYYLLWFVLSLGNLHAKYLTITKSQISVQLKKN